MSARHEVVPAIEPVNVTSLLQVIERAASNPQVDIDKMERLMAMHERMVAKQAEQAFNDAMAECQKEMRAVATDADNQQTRSRYATYSALDRVLRPIYTKHGFSISYDTDTSPEPEHIRVLAYVSHGAYTRTYKIDMPKDGKGAKGGDVMTKTHATGAGMSYGQRYLLKGIFNVRIGEEDADGNEPPPEALETAKGNLEAAAKQGMKALHKAWADLPNQLKVALKDMKETLKHKAADVDAAKAK